MKRAWNTARNDTYMVQMGDPIVAMAKKKRKRKTFTPHFTVTQREDALRAIDFEKRYGVMDDEKPILFLRFPDPEINRELVRNYAPGIETVFFQQNYTPRCCCVRLESGANVERTIETISKVPFGTGFMSAELKRQPFNDPLNADDMDPYALYVGNLPISVSAQSIKALFPACCHIDIGLARHMKTSRYAIVRFENFEAATEAFKRTVNTVIESRSIIVRFRRNRKKPMPGEIHAPTTVTNIPIERNESSTSAESKVETAAHTYAEPLVYQMEMWKQNSQQNIHKIINTNVLNCISAGQDQVEQSATNTSICPAQIKVEQQNDHSDEDMCNNSLLGMRYKESNIEVKTEVEIEPPPQVSTERIEYDEDFELDGDDSWPESPTTVVTTRNTVAQQSPEKKFDVNTMSVQLSSSSTSRLNEHLSFIAKLRAQVRRNNDSKRTRDELDDVFAQMNSDSGEEYDKDFI